MFDFDCVIAGAGVVGLAAARELAGQGRSVLVAEAAEDIGRATSSRNSEVIHAGIYYPEGSLKARLCVEGKSLLYEYCESRHVPARRLGKLIVATSEDQLPALARIQAHAVASGVHDLQRLTREQALALEPALSCVGALLSPSTGIVDSHAYMQALQTDGEAAGVEYVMRTPVLAVRQQAGGFVVDFGGEEPLSLSCGAFINAAGLHAPALAGRIEGLPAAAVPQAYFCKGSYAALMGRAPFTHLIYPVPDNAGLGVHLTLDMGGQARFGPDTEWIEGEDYTVHPERLRGFDAAVRKYWPGLPAGALEATYSGIRPKIVGPAEPAADFVIAGPADHGVAGLVNLFGIESPGLTASLAIARHVTGKLGG
ncbi:NAD(P)/FAD-dependent oxidoreductase [Verticiella sediminum]|uniref:NAD(P)/FAD-dependent oxidoreductase n=1 Tax=Verticiella sediminum TaxID=1247510 RepID=A0A556AVQ4_9BURK|nr:NAD(P)/FAD-dependent oxidoreductase [Verticiella sediminum]TSH97033.1 NAD(P)/FAD-dependent oxidoreductase [Verticiella sediminum]